MGSALVHELETNCASCTRIVKATRNPREEGDVFVDLEDAESISRALEIVKPNVIFHLAGAFFPCEKEDAHRLIVKPNVVGTENLMTAASEHNVVRVAMVSSMAAVRGGGRFHSMVLLLVSRTTTQSPNLRLDGEVRKR